LRVISLGLGESMSKDPKSVLQKSECAPTKHSKGQGAARRRKARIRRPQRASAPGTEGEASGRHRFSQRGREQGATKALSKTELGVATLVDRLLPYGPFKQRPNWPPEFEDKDRGRRHEREMRLYWLGYRSVLLVVLSGLGLFVFITYTGDIDKAIGAFGSVGKYLSAGGLGGLLTTLLSRGKK
jgi:hypothetical protein